MRIKIAGFGGEYGLANLQGRNSHSSSSFKCGIWNEWSRIVTCAPRRQRFRFAGISRNKEWTASYRHTSSDGAVSLLFETYAPTVGHGLDSGTGASVSGR